MTTPPPVPKSHRRSRKWPWVLGILIILSPIVAGLIWFISYRVSNNSAVRKREARVKQRGEPLTLAELQAKFPPIPDDENAAAILMAAWEEKEPGFWKAFRAGERPLPKRASKPTPADVPFIGKNAKVVLRSKPLSETNRAAAESYLLENRDQMDAMREAVKRPRARFPVKVTDGYHALLPHLPKIKSQAMCFQIEALLEADGGGANAAIASLRTMGRMSHLLREEPFLITQLVRMATAGMVINASEQLLSRQKLSPPQLREMRAILNELEITNALKTALLAERATALNVFKVPEAEALSLFYEYDAADDTPETASVKSRAGMRVLNALGIMSADKRLMLETFEDIITFSEQHSPEALDEFREIIDDAVLRSRDFPPKLYSALLLPPLARVADRFASLEARRRAAIVAMAVEEYRFAHADSLPATLDSLVPQYFAALPSDPFDGGPLRFKKLPKGFVVYSIGPNRIDDSGFERTTKFAQKNFDETFVVER